MNGRKLAVPPVLVGNDFLLQTHQTTENSTCGGIFSLSGGEPQFARPTLIVPEGSP
jgi:hypothetical protein